MVSTCITRGTHECRFNLSLRRCATSGRWLPALFAVAMTTFTVQVTAEPLPEGEAVPKTQEGSKEAPEAHRPGWKCCRKPVGYKWEYQWKPSCTPHDRTTHIRTQTLGVRRDIALALCSIATGERAGQTRNSNRYKNTLTALRVATHQSRRRVGYGARAACAHR